MGHAPVVLLLGSQGQLVIPADLRKELGLEEGTELVARVDGSRLVLESCSAVAGRLREYFAEIPGSLAEELIGERRQAAAGVPPPEPEERQ